MYIFNKKISPKLPEHSPLQKTNRDGEITKTVVFSLKSDQIAMHYFQKRKKRKQQNITETNGLKGKLRMKSAVPEFAVLQPRGLNLLNPIYARLYITVEERNVTHHP